MAERDEFERAFDRRPNGKWVQRRDGKTLTVFKRGEGTWCWSIFGADGTQFSDRSYECEGDAVGGLASELEVGTW
ncbi:MAG TPA: hypothetical protein VMR25_05495 [Planctomycetaceae bacterium]|nr:hypothetical protein [Planctomycetaceae bacterium]